MSIQPINFQGKQAFLPQATNENIIKLSKKMHDAKTCEFSSDGLRFSKHYLIGLKLKDNNAAIQYNCLKKQQKKSLSLKIENSKLDINYETGEILKIKKPFYKSLKSLLNKTQDVLTFFIENFDNKNKVEQCWFGFEGLTQKGMKQLFSKLDR